MKADDLTRSLVPLLLRKADKLNRGHDKRTGSGEGNPDGLISLGFMLGGCLQNPELQRAFGISRSLAKEA